MPKETPVICEGFTVLPVKVRESSPADHFLFLKEHNVRETNESKPRHRTLFVLNVPPYVNQECFERLFSSCGKVEAVHFHSKPSAGTPEPPLDKMAFFERQPQAVGYKVAYVVFKSEGSVKKVLDLPYSQTRVLFDKDHSPVAGVKKWAAEYREGLVSEKTLQSAIDTHMATYDERQEQEKKRVEEAEEVADDDGWVTVTRHGKHKAIPRTEAHEQRALAKERKKRKDKELLNFYAFQVRETKREHIANLRKKFEEDKQKIAIMKAARKFRPY